MLGDHPEQRRELARDRYSIPESTIEVEITLRYEPTGAARREVRHAGCRAARPDRTGQAKVPSITLRDAVERAREPRTYRRAPIGTATGSASTERCPARDIGASTWQQIPRGAYATHLLRSVRRRGWHRLDGTLRWHSTRILQRFPECEARLLCGGQARIVVDSLRGWEMERRVTSEAPAVEWQRDRTQAIQGMV